MLNTLIQISILLILMVLLIVQIVKRFCYYKPSNLRFEVAETFTPTCYKNLKGVYNIVNDKGKIVLFLTDFNENYSYYNNKMIIFGEYGYDTAVYDYSGFGESDGISNEKQLINDSKNMVISLLEKYHLDDIILCGYGMGSFLALYTAMEFKMPKVIINNPISSIKYKLHKYMPKFIFNEYDIESNCKNYKGKILCFTKHKIKIDNIQYHEKFDIELVDDFLINNE